MTTTSDNTNDEAVDSALDQYWAMHLRADQDQKRIGQEAAQLQRDHDQRTQDLAELHRRREEIENNIKAQEAMLRTVAAQIGDLTGQQGQARRIADVHAASVARLVQETGRPHPQPRFEAASRQAIAEQMSQRSSAQPPHPAAPPETEQGPARPPAAAPPLAPEEPSTGESSQSGPFSRLRNALPASNGSKA